MLRTYARLKLLCACVSHFKLRSTIFGSKSHIPKLTFYHSEANKNRICHIFSSTPQQVDLLKARCFHEWQEGQEGDISPSAPRSRAEVW